MVGGGDPKPQKAPEIQRPRDWPPGTLEHLNSNRFAKSGGLEPQKLAVVGHVEVVESAVTDRNG